MVTINITDKNKAPLRFILEMFLETHEQDDVIYPEEILIVKKILRKLNTYETKPITKSEQAYKNGKEALKRLRQRN